MQRRWRRWNCMFQMSNVSWITRRREEPFFLAVSFMRAGRYHRTIPAIWGWVIPREDGLVLCCLVMKRCWLQLYTGLREQSEGAHSHVYTRSHTLHCWRLVMRSAVVFTSASLCMAGVTVCELEQGLFFMECFVIWKGHILHIFSSLLSQSQMDRHSPFSCCRGQKSESRLMDFLFITFDKEYFTIMAGKTSKCCFTIVL